jgi:hypothetical protein
MLDPEWDIWQVVKRCYVAATNRAVELASAILQKIREIPDVETVAERARINRYIAQSSAQHPTIAVDWNKPLSQDFEGSFQSMTRLTISMLIEEWVSCASPSLPRWRRTR